MKSKLISVCMFCSLIFLLSPMPALAGLGVSGVLLMADVNPGQSITHEIIVDSDQTDSPMDLVAEVVGFGQSLDGANMNYHEISGHIRGDLLTVTPRAFTWILDLSR
jgi:hypothetical protein